MKTVLYAIFSLILLQLGILHAQVIDELIDPISAEISPTDQLTVIFEDLQKENTPGSMTPTRTFVIQHSNDITKWEQANGLDESGLVVRPAVMGPVPDIAGRHIYTLTVPGYVPDLPRKFFRVIAFSSVPGDSDGDKLSNALEARIGTSLEIQDTDNDGSNDAKEFALGTDPRDANDFPNQSPLPAIAFELNQWGVNEGVAGGTYEITVNTESAFSGTLSVRYSVDPLSSAKAPGDISSPASESPDTETVQLTGGTGTIKITLVDDLLVSPQRLLILNLEPDSNVIPAYRLGGRTTHIVILEDNDCYWSGLLKDDITERNFRLRMLRQGTFVQTDFVTGEASDGAFKLDLDWPQWGPQNPPADYKVGEAVINNGVGYRCLQQHGFAASNEPGVGPNWTSFWDIQKETSQSEGVVSKDDSSLLGLGDAIFGGKVVGDNFEIGEIGTSSGENKWPRSESPDNAIDGVGQKYLNFGETNTGIVVTPSGPSVATRLQLWPANDSVERDPASYKIYGTDESVGTTQPLADFTLISEGELSLTDGRSAGGRAVLPQSISQTVTFANTQSYTSYLIVFPSVKDETSANSMQIAEIQLYKDAPTKQVWSAPNPTVSLDPPSPATARVIIESEPMPAPNAGFVSQGVQLWRVLTLDADETVQTDPKHSIKPSEIIGKYTEKITAGPSTTYLDRTMEGQFVLAKAIPDPPQIANPLDPTAP